MDFHAVLVKVLSQIEWRFECLREVLEDFNFCNSKFLMSKTVNELKISAKRLANKYPDDFHAGEIDEEITIFKFQAASLFKESEDFSNVTSLDTLSLIHEMSLATSYLNPEIVFRLFLTLPVTNASAERSRELKIIKYYLRSSMSQEKLGNMAILSIEEDKAKSINYKNIKEDSAAAKVRKVRL